MSKTLMEKLGLTEDDFKKPTVTNEERIEAIEEAITELAEILVGGEDD